MAEKFKNTAQITSVEKLQEDIVSMWVKDAEIAAVAKPGQFVSLYCKDGSRLLPRPISICEVNYELGMLRFVYRIAGEGTKEIATYKVGDTIEVMGPLGNGFTLEGKKAILIGGGIGIPPMLELAKQLKAEKSIVLGYRNQTFMDEEFLPFGEVYIATEDGTKGVKGNVIDAIKQQQLEADIIFACGPTNMLRGIKEYALEHNITAQLSLEERMACGIGACLACVCKTKEVDHHTHVHNTRVCKDGPVFYAQEVEL